MAVGQGMVMAQDQEISVVQDVAQAMEMERVQD